MSKNVIFNNPSTVYRVFSSESPIITGPILIHKYFPQNKHNWFNQIQSFLNIIYTYQTQFHLAMHCGMIKYAMIQPVIHCGTTWVAKKKSTIKKNVTGNPQCCTDFMWNPLLDILLGLPILDQELLFSNNNKSANHLSARLPAQQALYHFQ